MECDFEKIGPRHFRCRRLKCGREVHSKQDWVSSQIHAGCRVRDFLSGLRRLKNFTVALIAHVARKLPTCTQEEIDERMAVCVSCPLFKNGICTHPACGCNVNDQRKFLNKLAWKDQRCPDSKW